MTGYLPTNEELMFRNLPKVLRLAEAAQVTSVLFTGKGEPCQDLPSLLDWMDPFQAFHTELQTNGLMLDNAAIEELAERKLNVLAFSLDKLTEFEKFARWVELAKVHGMVTRATLNITNRIPPRTTFRDILAQAKKWGYQQLSLRAITVPNNAKTSRDARAAVQWIRCNARWERYDRLCAQLLLEGNANGRVIRKLPFGALVYDIAGTAVTAFDYCVQDMSYDDDIRSLIFLEDGHVYTAWNSAASILF
jgi:hypothetical protein